MAAYSNWTLTDISVPAHIHTTDGMVTIEEVDCSGVVGNIQDWESSLLQNTNTEHPIHKIFDTISAEDFIIAADGSSGDTLMSFGWKISDHKGETLVQHVGPAFGQASSFRSEAYGILPVMLFLHYAKEYAQYNEQ
eukprot:10297353-Ditylum_brightwellii.AAC.1